MNDEFGDRMKSYEKCYSQTLPERLPVIIRLDGRAFHTLTRREFDRPFDHSFHQAMRVTAQAMCADVQNCRFAYTQSDEISLLIYPKYVSSQMWLGNKVQKMVSVAAGLASAVFNHTLIKEGKLKDSTPCFDARTYVLPVFEVKSYFWWRQSDAIRNSVSMLARSHFSAKELHCKNVAQMKQMLLEDRGVNWDSIPTWQQQGSLVTKNSFFYAPNFLDANEIFEEHLAQPTMKDKP